MFSLHANVSKPVSKMIIDQIDVLALQARTSREVRTSFGIMHVRPAVLVRLKAEDGTVGWGESWVNFPSWSLHERIYTIAEGLAPRLVGLEFDKVQSVVECLRNDLRILSLQWGAPGPVAQSISAIDVALWDLKAKSEGVPLYRLLGGDRSHIPVYASGLGPVEPVALARHMADFGVTAFKLKVGFDRQVDLENLANLRREFGHDATLLVDVNQAWSLRQALSFLPALQDQDVHWLEEPLAADDADGWSRLAEVSSIPLAAGENIYDARAFGEHLKAGTIGVAQPDVTKTGGISFALDVLRYSREHGRDYALHFLGSVVGLTASAHVHASTVGTMPLEFDANPNPLREQLDVPLQLDQGSLVLSDAPGLGFDLPIDALQPFIVHHRTIRRDDRMSLREDDYRVNIGA